MNEKQEKVMALQGEIRMLLMKDGMGERASLIAAGEIIEMVAESGLSSDDIKAVVAP
ncbi:MAG: hypothetical protein HRT35_00845 [Algicola sp.]|nr:hypothetical protein [Algicola sp.]